MIGNAQKRMQCFPLRLLCLGEQAGVLERECCRQRDLLEILQVELRKLPVRPTADREDAENAAAGSERQDHALAHIRQLLLHVGWHPAGIGEAFECPFAAVDLGAKFRRESHLAPIRAGTRVLSYPAIASIESARELGHGDAIHVNQFGDAFDDRLDDPRGVEG